MKQCSLNKNSHNLNIKMYRFEEILGLFKLKQANLITEEDMKNAKTIVLRMHPDKSRLSPEYFLFYKKAFDILKEFYDNQIKIDKPIPQEPIKYQSYGKGIDSGLNRAANQEIQETVHKMKTTEFTTLFNELFEKNMLNYEKQNKDKEQIKWFYSEEEPETLINNDLNQGGTIHDKVETIRKNNANMYLTRYNGVQTLYTGSNVGNLYDDLDDSDSTYKSSDPFGKLKYDDLRKVHKDQTVFVVSDRITPIQSVVGVEKLQTIRANQDLTPIDKSEAERIITDQEKRYRELMMKKEYAAKLQTMQYEEKSKAVRSQFLQLRNV
jgi:hypothetical protein